jgi:hypothetical protein
MGVRVEFRMAARQARGTAREPDGTKCRDVIPKTLAYVQLTVSQCICKNHVFL